MDVNLVLSAKSLVVTITSTRLSSASVTEIGCEMATASASVGVSRDDSAEAAAVASLGYKEAYVVNHSTYTQYSKSVCAAVVMTAASAHATEVMAQPQFPVHSSLTHWWRRLMNACTSETCETKKSSTKTHNHKVNSLEKHHDGQSDHC